MNQLKDRWLLYFISSVILATLCIQVYWNYKNYQAGKQQLINDVQTSLDNTVDNYYTNLAKNETFGFISDSLHIDNIFTGVQLNKGIEVLDSAVNSFTQIRMNNIDGLKEVSIASNGISDSVRFTLQDSISKLLKSDSIFFIEKKRPFEILTSKIVISIAEDTLSLNKIDELLLAEFRRKNLDIEYGLTHSVDASNGIKLRENIINVSSLKAVSKSPFLMHHATLSVHYGNITLAVLKKNLLGILLSFLLLGSVIGCLLYMLRIIKQQKQLAEVKNDLISNITHEFKTPIATIGAAMEGIQGFNTENDTERNLRYAKISSDQVEKLNGMVEKLLETATLDSESLQLNFESENLVELLRKATTKESFSLENKKLTFHASEENIPYSIDIFHFENAINNLIDNAIKYGGDTMTVRIEKGSNTIHIEIKDSGTSLSEVHRKRIFEKFYRVPKGNTHDVKGFGIGLYYSKKIIEKHGGSMSLLSDRETTFMIQLPYE